MKNRDIHLDILKLTVKALGELADDLVFIGGQFKACLFIPMKSMKN
jgi:hypothetical protein